MNDHTFRTEPRVGDGAASFFRGHDHVLAVVSAGRQRDVELAAIDKFGSLMKVDLAGTRQRYAYSPYGQGRACTCGFTGIGFTGQLYQTLINGYLLGNGHRLYSPGIARFYSADRESPFAKGGLNAYTYCQGDPINFIDPLGKWPWVGKPIQRSNSLYVPTGQARLPTGLARTKSLPHITPVARGDSEVKFRPWLAEMTKQYSLKGSISVRPKALERVISADFDPALIRPLDGLEITQAFVDVAIYGGKLSFFADGRDLIMLKVWRDRRIENVRIRAPVKRGER